MGGEAAGDVAEVDVGAHALVGEALHQQAVAVVLDALVAGDVFLVADAVAFGHHQHPITLTRLDVVDGHERVAVNAEISTTMLAYVAPEDLPSRLQDPQRLLLGDTH